MEFLQFTRFNEECASIINLLNYAMATEQRTVVNISRKVKWKHMKRELQS